MGMHVPAATVSQMGLLMSGHVTNSTVASLSPPARAMVMNAMPVSAAHVAVGAILHSVRVVVGIVLAIAFHRRGVSGGLPGSR